MAEGTTERLLLTVEEAARRLGIGRTLAWQLVRQGELPVVRLGRCVRIPWQALQEWVARQVKEGS
jgi:excisionase family DNA binding protein